MDRDRIMARIRDFAASPKNVRFEDLESLLDKHIKYVVQNYNHHHKSSHHVFTLGRSTFTVTAPVRGCLKARYVDLFLEKMEAEGLFGPEEES